MSSITNLTILHFKNFFCNICVKIISCRRYSILNWNYCLLLLCLSSHSLSLSCMTHTQPVYLKIIVYKSCCELFNQCTFGLVLSLISNLTTQSSYKKYIKEIHVPQNVTREVICCENFVEIIQVFSIFFKKNIYIYIYIKAI